MPWCSYCKKITGTRRDIDKLCCTDCGKIASFDDFSEEVTFVKNTSGQSRVEGNYVNNFKDDYSRTLTEASNGINDLICTLGIDQTMGKPALGFYKIASQRNFTRGRRKELVHAACLYLSCRVNHKPHLLIDFSDFFRINVYVLGAVYLQLCKFLSLQNHPVVQSVVDPSLFIHRFTNSLFDDENQLRVSRTALRIVASMKRDWMQTGRKPSGLCGAALYVSALSHGFKCSKSKIIKAVHVCEATLTKRLVEFENTESGGLTIEEFNMKAKEFEEDERLVRLLKAPSNESGIEKICAHNDEMATKGLCQSCYKTFIKFLGGLNGGSDPPAFQRVEKERIKSNAAAADSPVNVDSSTLPGLAEKMSKVLKSDEERSIKNVNEHEVLQPAESDSTGDTLPSRIIQEPNDDREHAGDASSKEPDSLSDIDDMEVDDYLHTEEEKKLKKIIWEEMNKEYMEEQAEKEAAKIAAKKAFEANFSNCSEDVQAAQKLAAAAAAAVANSKKERRKKRTDEIKKAGPPQSAAEAAKHVLDRKRLSSKIRYDVLEQLFDESEIRENKKTRTEAECDDENRSSNDNKENPSEYPFRRSEEGTEDFDDNMEEYEYVPEDNFFDDYD